MRIIIVITIALINSGCSYWINSYIEESSSRETIHTTDYDKKSNLTGYGKYEEHK